MGFLYLDKKLFLSHDTRKGKSNRVKDKVKEWIELARIDLTAAVKLSGEDLLTPAASFHAHQCVEKLFKALIENADSSVPKIHEVDKQ